MKAKETLVSLSWDDFEQDGWGNAVDIDDVYGDLALVKFQVEGVPTGTDYYVNITAIGE